MDDMISLPTNTAPETLMGRKRWLRIINSANFTVRVVLQAQRHQLAYTGHCSRYDQTGDGKSA